MANNIALFKKYIDNLDEVYGLGAKSSATDSDQTLARAGANTNEIIIPTIDMDGLADYDRGSGYISGDVTLKNETVKFNYDRGRTFTVDAMDNEETVGLAFGKLAAEFVRTKVAPEMDAFRFATYASAEGISKVSTGAALSTSSAVLEALRAAVTRMDEDQVSEDSRILYITPTLYGLIEDTDSYKSKKVLESFATVVKVPQSRFYTAITLQDGKTEGQTAGGFKKAAGAKDINFMVIDKRAVMQYNKHIVSKVISPEENQTSDGWKFYYRAYGLTGVYANKRAGIYLHYKA